MVTGRAVLLWEHWVLSRVYLALWFFVLIAAGFCWPIDAARAEIVLRDAVGREVHLKAPAQRIVTNESLLLYYLALIDPDPVSKIAGWSTPRRIDSGVYKTFKARFPTIEAIPDVSALMPANASAEGVLSARPDLFVVSIWQADWNGIAAQLEASGVPVIFLDGPEVAKLSPGDATAFSIQLLGKAIGQDRKAEDFAAFVKARFARVKERLTAMENRPDVLIDVHAGSLCCYTPGSGNRITQYLELAGGHSIGADIAPGYDGQLSPEFVVSNDPDLYIATGSPHLAAQGGMAIGGDITAEVARRSLRDVTSRNLLGALSAVQKGRAFAVSHQLAISALSVLVFECFAKWTHPEAFADLDPARTLAEINERFLAVPLEGTFWIGLDD